MAHLATVGSHRVNGVSRIHTDLMKRTIFADFETMAPGTVINITNGITPRRWLIQANPGLAALITRRIGAEWTRDLSALRQLAPLAGDAGVRAEFRAVKLAAKRRLAAIIRDRLRVHADPASMFDVHVKRIHEYKRQLLNVLHVVTRYNRLREGRDLAPRTVIFSGKAAPGYAMAKLIIELIHGVARAVNHDPAVAGRLAVAFIPNYSVTTAERLIPASDLSEQISTAGMEASGTGNMKLALNGALTMGTLDGATIEMRDAVGSGNMFTFGMTADEVAARRAAGYHPAEVLHGNSELREVVTMIAGGAFSSGRRDRFQPIVDALTVHGDAFFVLADYASYIACQEEADEVFRNPEEWTRRAMLNVAGMGWFSSDRTVLEYATNVWGVQPQAADDADHRR
jgi:starch phosphorylase